MNQGKNKKGNILISDKVNLIIALLFSLCEIFICLLYDGCYHHQKMMFYLSLPVVLAGRNIFINGFKNLFRFKINLDSLIAIGAAAALLLSGINTFVATLYGVTHSFLFVYFEPAVVIITLGLTGKYLLYQPIDSFMKLETNFPKQARLLSADKETMIAIDAIRVGNILLVKKGELFPADGLLYEGLTEADESFIKRAASIRKYPGDQIIGGSVNKVSDVKIRVTHTGSEAVINKLSKVLEDRTTNSTKMVDKVASRYLLGLFIISIITIVCWLMIFPKEGLGNIIRHGAEVLIVGCPCALALAMPLALTEGFDRIINKGILVKDTEALDKFEKIDTLVVDKSGVLTLGRPEVAELIWKGDASRRERLQSIIFSVERKAEDAYAASIAEYFSTGKTEGIEIEEMDEFESRGVRAKIKGEIFYIGTEAFVGMIDHGRYFKKPDYIIHEISGMEYFFDDVELQEQIHKVKESGLKVFLAADSKAVFAIIGIGEGIKKTTLSAVKDLKEKNINLVLMTGESREAALSVAEKLKIKDIYPEVLPFAKSDVIRSLQSKGKVVAFAGSGIEDAPALAQADVSFVMVSGSDIATENADAVLLNGDISKITEVIDLSKSLKSIIKKNIFWSLIFNLAGVVIAAGLIVSFTGLMLTSGIATLIMAIGTIAVVLNNLRVKKL